VKSCLVRVCLLLLILVACACASQPVAPPSEWRYEKGSIHLDLKAADQLNLYEGMPHTLLVCVYQLTDPNAFNQLSENKDGLYKLLECSRFDPTVASAKRLIVHPGQDMVVTLDRGEGAQYVGLVAGYYRLEREATVRLYKIPWFVEKKGFIRRTKTPKPDQLTIHLVLGSQGLYSVYK